PLGQDNYKGPELYDAGQLPDAWVRPAQDVYGLGCVLSALQQAVLPAQPAWLAQLVRECRGDDPARRPSAAEVRRYLSETSLLLFRNLGGPPGPGPAPVPESALPTIN